MAEAEAESGGNQGNLGIAAKKIGKREDRGEREFIAAVFSALLFHSKLRCKFASRCDSRRSSRARCFGSLLYFHLGFKHVLNSLMRFQVPWFHVLCFDILHPDMFAFASLPMSVSCWGQSRSHSSVHVRSK